MMPIPATKSEVEATPIGIEPKIRITFPLAPIRVSASTRRTARLLGVVTGSPRDSTQRPDSNVVSGSSLYALSPTLLGLEHGVIPGYLVGGQRVCPPP